MELDSYGINSYFTGSIQELDLTTIQTSYRSSSSLKTQFGEYIILSMLGEGTYGKTYLVKPTTENNTYAIKVMDVQNEMEIRNIISEVLMNILLYEGTAYETNGPYVPRVYEVAISSDRNTIMVRYERMTGTLGQYLNHQPVSANDRIVPQAILDILKLLGFLETKFQFNHRDLKSDNIMYVLKDNKPVWRLIDLGASCMKWNGYTLSSASIFASDRPCIHIGRDITFLLTELVLDIRPISNQLRLLLQSFITFPIHGRECALDSTRCNQVKYKTWTNIYNLLNKSNIINPHIGDIKVQLEAYLKATPKQKLRRKWWSWTQRKPGKLARSTRKARKW